MASEENASVRSIDSNFSIDNKIICRGPASEWGEVATQCMRVSSKARRFLADELLVRHPNRFQEYFLDCNFGEVRMRSLSNFKEN